MQARIEHARRGFADRSLPTWQLHQNCGALGFEPSLSGSRVRRNSTFAWRAYVGSCHAGGGARTRTLQCKGLLLCRSSSAGVARDRGVEPRHCGAKTRRRPLTGSSRTLVPSPRIKRGTRSSDDRMIFVSTRGRENGRNGQSRTDDSPSRRERVTITLRLFGYQGLLVPSFKAPSRSSHSNAAFQSFGHQQALYHILCGGSDKGERDC